MLEFSEFYLPNSRLPTKAIDILEQACTVASLRSLSENNNQENISQIKGQDVEIIRTYAKTLYIAHDNIVL